MREAEREKKTGAHEKQQSEQDTAINTHAHTLKNNQLKYTLVYLWGHLAGIDVELVNIAR